MRHENKKWLELFETIIKENGYYEELEKHYRNEPEIVGFLSDYYLDYVDFTSPYHFLDCIEDYMRKHKVDAETALKQVAEDGTW